VLCPIADAQCAPLAVGAGNLGNGITDTWYSTSGFGGSATTDSFVNSFVGPTAAQGFGSPFGFGGCGFPALGACGISPFASFGPFQTGVGGNWGTQNSAANGAARATTFGLQPIGLAFGIPVAGPGGLLYT
jgi:hypothetical protein